MANKLFLRRTIHTICGSKVDRAFRICFKDGTASNFAYVWLRDCCLNDHTYVQTAALKGRLHFMRDFDTNIEPLHHHLDANGNKFFVKWADGVESEYDANWLKTRNLSNPLVQQTRKKFYFEHAEPWCRDSVKLQKFDFLQCLNDDKILHDMLVDVCVKGIALLTNGPGEKTGEEAVYEIGNRIGLIQRTHFGEVFEVCTKPRASNMAYASGSELPYHTDFPSLSQPPELQLLYMCQRARCGGLSMFVDGFHIAEQMRKENPEAFHLLCTTPIEYIEEGFDEHKAHSKDGSERLERFHFDMVAHHPVFDIDRLTNEVKSVYFGNVMRSWYLNVNPKQIQQIYDALKLFTEHCYRPENQLIFQLENRECVLFDNRRLLHARTAFDNPNLADGKESGVEEFRQIAGCYFSWDIVKSKIRLLRDLLSHPDNQKSI